MFTHKWYDTKSANFRIMRKRGFTLIELLIVIAIIGILASIILVSLAGAREKSRDSRREADLVQIHRAIELYRANNNGTLPVGPGWCTQLSNPIYPQMRNAIVPGYISVLPQDPLNPGTATDYFFAAGTEGNFTVAAELEGSDENVLAEGGCADAPAGTSSVNTLYDHLLRSQF